MAIATTTFPLLGRKMGDCVHGKEARCQCLDETGCFQEACYRKVTDVIDATASVPVL